MITGLLTCLPAAKKLGNAKQRAAWDKVEAAIAGDPSGNRWAWCQELAADKKIGSKGLAYWMAAASNQDDYQAWLDTGAGLLQGFVLIWTI